MWTHIFLGFTEQWNLFAFEYSIYKNRLDFFKHTPRTKGYLKKGKKKMCPKNLNWNNFPEPEGFQNRKTTAYCSDLIKAEKLIWHPVVKETSSHWKKTSCDPIGQMIQVTLGNKNNKGNKGSTFKALCSSKWRRGWIKLFIFIWKQFSIWNA